MAVDREGLARALREARGNHGMSQATAAKRVGLSRTVLAQIELGNRTASPAELTKLAKLYGTTAADFSHDAAPNHDVLAMLSANGLAIPSELQPVLETVVGLCIDAGTLENLLGRSRVTGPPHYDLPRPRSTADAIMQGEQVADQERHRLGLGPGSSVDNVSDLVASQGTRVAVLKLPEEVAGIYIRHSSTGSLIVTGTADTRVPRFGLLHEYAFALFERERSLIVTTPLNSDELIQIRAAAFAAAFLLPQSGIESAVRILDKGRPSRKALAVFGYAAEELLEAEVRSTPGSQTLSSHDVASIAGRFGASYEATVYRLRALDFITKAETEDLLTRERRRAASAYTTLFATRAEPDVLHATEPGAPLKREVVHLAIEAYRRGLTSKGDLVALAPKLQLSVLTPAKLVELAEGVR
jgi:transcriptional regulator with XRE-family HTH domain/Zn-dependent peptidase ImmA (M78 family)